MSDILVTKNLAAFRAFNNEFKHLLPNDNAAMFYVKRDNNIIPFRGFAFRGETGELRVQVLLVNGKVVQMPVEMTDEVYFTTNVLYLSDYATYVSSLTSSSLDLSLTVHKYPAVTPTPT